MPAPSLVEDRQNKDYPMRTIIALRTSWLRSNGLGLRGNALLGALAVALLMVAVMVAVLPGY